MGGCNNVSCLIVAFSEICSSYSDCNYPESGLSPLDACGTFISEASSSSRSSISSSTSCSISSSSNSNSNSNSSSSSSSRRRSHSCERVCIWKKFLEEELRPPRALLHTFLLNIYDTFVN